MTTQVDIDEQRILTVEERAALKALESRISQGWQGFTDVGQALLEVRERRLYRAEHKTWGDYCEQVWGWSRQRAQQLMDGAETAAILSTTGLQLQNEREARELKGTAQIVQALEPEMQQAVAQYLKTATGSERPTTSQVKAAAEVAQSIDTHATVAHPDTGAEVPYAALTGEQRAATLAENVSTGTHERMQRQQQHIQEKVLEANQAGRGGWADWLMNRGKSLTPDQELQLVIRLDPSGNSVAFVRLIDASSHLTLACGETAPYAKKAVLQFVEENGR